MSVDNSASTLIAAKMKAMYTALVIFLMVFSTQADDPLCTGLPSDQEILFPSPIACVQYYKCLNGLLTVETCPGGLYFSEINNGCVEPEYAECLGGTGTISPPTDPNTPTTTTPIPTIDTITPSTATTEITTTRPSVTTTTPIAVTTTPRPPSTPTSITTPNVPSTPTITTTTQGVIDPRCSDNETSYWPHPSQCNLYIECYQNESYEMACPPNKYFSKGHGRCVEASQSECCINNSSKCN